MLSVALPDHPMRQAPLRLHLALLCMPGALLQLENVNSSCKIVG